MALAALQEQGFRIDWNLAIQVSVPILTLVLGGFLDRWLERRPKLITFFSHTSVFKLRVKGDEALTIHSHTLVVRNAGQRVANNVRVGHHYLPPDHFVYPPCEHSITRLQDDAAEIVFPGLAPEEQVTISYIYYPPVIFNQIHSGVKSDDGLARVLHVLPTPQLGPKVVALLKSILLVGVMTLVYLAVVAIRLLF